MEDFDEKIEVLVSEFAPSKLRPPRNGVKIVVPEGFKYLNEGENAGVLGEDLVGKEVCLFLKRGRVVGVKGTNLERWEIKREVGNALANHREFRPLMEEALKLLNFQYKADNGFLEVQQKDLAFKLAVSWFIQNKRGGYEL